MHDIWPQLKPWVKAGEPFALATVVKARNPSPRGIGSVLAIDASGERFIGSVSAGCVEMEVIELARACMKDGMTRWAKFGPSQGLPWEVAFSCGGKIQVRIEPFEYDELVLPELISVLDNCEVATWMNGEGKQVLLREDGSLVGEESQWSADSLKLARKHLAERAETREIETEDGKLLLRSLTKPNRLFIVGAVHIAVHLVSIAKSLNYRAIVIDPRESYAQPERFEVAPYQLIRSWPEEALAAFALHELDCAAMLTHDPKIDDQALAVFLKSNCAYMGALGSKRSHAARLKRLSAAGFGEEDLRRIHGPIGLDIGSRTPAEIAISIMAEIVRVKNSILEGTLPETAKRVGKNPRRARRSTKAPGAPIRN